MIENHFICPRLFSSYLINFMKNGVMKKIVLVVVGVLVMMGAYGQEKKHTVDGGMLPNLQSCIHTAQQNLQLYVQGQPNDVNSIIKDIERYIDSMPKNKTTADLLLMKHFAPLRHFFLTTTNKTSVAAEFLYNIAPYSFCMYNDTALTLYIGAVKDGDPYNLNKTTEKRIAQLAMTNCLLPSLAALDEFKGSDIKYVALSVYYGCKDSRDGAPKAGVAPYCLMLVARLSDVQQYAAGLITDKGLLAVGEVYVSDGN